MKIKFVLLIGIFSGTILIYQFSSIAAAGNEDKANIKKYNIECRSGGQALEGVYVFKDDELGWYKSCVMNNLSHGPVIIWKNNRVAIKGEYQNGKRHGVFTYYYPDGSIKRQVLFENDVIIHKQ